MYEMFEMYLSFLFCTVLVKTAWGAPWVQEQAVFSGPGYEVLGRPAVPVNQRPIVESEKGNSMILSFDDIPLAHATANITHYSHFNISSYQLFNPVLASKENITEPEDNDCAVSFPNALLARRDAGADWPCFISPTPFHLKSISSKAIGFIPSGLTIRLQGYEIVDGHVMNVYEGSLMYIRDGYQPMLRVPNWWPGQINKLEMWAETKDRNDWRFCVDNLEVEFVE